MKIQSDLQKDRYFRQLAYRLRQTKNIMLQQKLNLMGIEMKIQNDTYYNVYSYLSNHGEYNDLTIEGKIQLIEEIHRDIVFDLQVRRNENDNI